MTWSYRIIRHKDKYKVWYAVHEVFYHKNGKPYSVTEKPVDIIGDNQLEVKDAIFMILKDAFYYPVLDMKFFDKKKRKK